MSFRLSCGLQIPVASLLYFLDWWGGVNPHQMNVLLMEILLPLPCPFINKPMKRRKAKFLSLVFSAFHCLHVLSHTWLTSFITTLALEKPDVNLLCYIINMEYVFCLCVPFLEALTLLSLRILSFFQGPVGTPTLGSFPSSPCSLALNTYVSRLPPNKWWLMLLVKSW